MNYIKTKVGAGKSILDHRGRKRDCSAFLFFHFRAFRLIRGGNWSCPREWLLPIVRDKHQNVRKEAAMKAIFTSKKTWLALLAVAGLPGVAWWQRRPVLAWYHVRQLTNAYQENREACAKKVAELDEAALPHVLLGLRSPDAIVCANMQCALALIAKKWGVGSPRSQQLVERICAQLDKFSPAGQEKILLLLTCFIQQDRPTPLPPRLTKVVSEILLNAEKKEELPGVSLLLAAALLHAVHPAPHVHVCPHNAHRSLHAPR